MQKLGLITMSLFLIAACAAGCSKEKQPQNDGNSSTKTNSVNRSDANDSKPDSLKVEMQLKSLAQVEEFVGEQKGKVVLFDLWAMW